MQSVSYSQGVAQFAHLFGPAPPDAANFVASLVPPGGRVLDIGAGVGDLAFALAGAGHSVTALEPDREMFAVLLSRLALRADLHERVTPIPAAAGFELEPAFDVVTNFAVLHLLPPEERLALARYAVRMAQPGGRVVLEIPVASAARQPTPLERVGERQLGEVIVEKHSAMAPAQDGWWHTHWAFRVLRHGQLIHQVERTFHWYPLPPNEALALVEAAGLEPVDRFGGVDGAPFAADQSKTLLVVGRPLATMNH